MVYIRGLNYAASLTRRFLTTGVNNTTKYLKIGNVQATIKAPKNPELVPALKLPQEQPQILLQHLKWLLQKDMLKQDVFLLGVPGSIRSSLVLLYLQTINREFEYLTVTRDTTEADIKQRREIRGGSAIYTDLCAVRAALNGRVLIIDGVEKAERNVLPIINNLLENREMQLDDGRFIMHHEKFDKLAEKYSLEELKAMGLERVSPDFHVIALGLPVPRFAGHTLDPPLRSRFQCRHVVPLPFQTMLMQCLATAPDVIPERIKNLVSLAYAVNSQSELRLPLIPVDNLQHVMKIWNAYPEYSGADILRLIYPVESILKSHEIETVNEFIEKFKVTGHPTSGTTSLKSVETSGDQRKVVIQKGKRQIELEFPAAGSQQADDTFISTKNQEELLTDLAVAYSQGDFALLGAKGSGKTRILTKLCRTLGLDTETMVLYQDMNSRELIQRRRMLPEGDTVWEDSQLVTAAKQGITCILDGVERTHWSALESISSLLHHRRLYLPDGSRLVGEEEFERTRENTGETDEGLAKKGIFKIPSSFRLIFVGDSSISESKWINDSLLSLVPYYSLKPLSVEDQTHVIHKLVPEASLETILRLVSFVNDLRTSHDVGLKGVAVSLSLRKLIHIIRRDCLHSGELKSLVEKASLSKFLPSTTRHAFNEALAKSNLPADVLEAAVPADDFSALRNVKHKKMTDETLVPDVLFYENEQHFGVMCDMARDFRLGAHLLLIGNQGVGKNKIADRFMSMINRPRQYLQLHRDTTVESLTVKTSVEEKLVRHEDSVLVKAAREGHILVLDEADKAPLHVIAVLKSLLDTGTLVLGDGRRLQPAGLPATENSIPLHPEFKIIMLANRPGFPFLGNDLFAVLGDLFSIHTIDNPSPKNEMAMLKNYGPSVSEATLSKMIAVFGELRSLADDGTLTYPYSTRELVNIVKHINKFPDDSLVTVVKNVFDFDEYSESYRSVEEVFRRHGIPLGVDRVEGVVLSEKFTLGPLQSLGRWGTRDAVEAGHPVTYPINQGKPIEVGVETMELYKEHMRSNLFTEQECMWRIPMLDANLTSDALFSGDRLFISTVNPPRLYSIKNLEFAQQVQEINIHPLLASAKRPMKYQPRIRMSEFGEEHILIHEEVSNKALLYNKKDQTAREMNLSESLLDNITEYFSSEDRWRMMKGDSPVIYERGGRTITILDPETTTSTKLEYMEDIEQIMEAGEGRWLIKDKSGQLSLLKKEDGVWKISTVQTPDELRLQAVRPSSDNSVIMKADGYYFVKSNSPESSGELQGCVRVSPPKAVDSRRPYYLSDDSTKKYLDSNRNLVVLEGGIVVSGKPNWDVPKEALRPDVPLSHVSGFLEVVDTKNRMVQYVPVPCPKYETYHGSWVATMSKTPFFISQMDGNKLVSVDTSGTIRAYELSTSTIAASFESWRKMIAGEEENLRMEMSRDEKDFDLSKLDTPKLGKFDPLNAPHVGGNTWMGGTGGYNTAGLGGVGGPFRLDAGHDVYQMPELAKQQVPAHILEKAREIAKAEYKKKLKEIEMSEYDADAYNSLWKKVEGLSGRLKGIVEQLEAKRRERLWARHQTSGDLDDSKLIEGITGEKNIYRRRLDKLPEPGTPQEKAKRLRVVFDVSGSMYRFNGYDKRLQRSLEAALLVMTALDGKEDKVLYDIVGHSGDSPCTQFVVNGNYPKNNKDRLNVLKSMLAHTQYCSSGDFTVEGLDVAIKELEEEEESDEKLVVLISDANLDRYGIKPRHLTDIMNKTDDVRSFVIFIGSLGEQAEKLQKNLPAGTAFVCKNTGDLPQIMQNIFSSTLV